MFWLGIDFPPGGLSDQALSFFWGGGAALHGMRDLSSWTRDRTCSPVQWKHRVLTTGPPGNFWPSRFIQSKQNEPTFSLQEPPLLTCSRPFPRSYSGCGKFPDGLEWDPNLMVTVLLRGEGSVSPTNLFLLQAAPSILSSAFKILGGNPNSSLFLTLHTWFISTVCYV